MHIFKSWWQFKTSFIRTMKVIIFIFLLFQVFHYNSFGQKSKLLETFPLSSPEQQGISSSTLDSMMLFIKKTNQNIHHLTIMFFEGITDIVCLPLPAAS